MAVGVGLLGCDDVNPGSHKLAPPGLLRFEIDTGQPELFHLKSERLQWDPGIDQGAQDHVAADPAVAIEIRDPHN